MESRIILLLTLLWTFWAY